MFRLSQNPSTKTPKPVNSSSSSSSSSGNNESTVSTTPGIKPSQVYKEQRLSAVLLKRSTSTGSTSTSTGSSTGGRVAGIVGDRSSVAAAFSGETNFSNEEIENVNNVVEESGAGGVSCTSQMSHDSLDKSADKNIYYNDMKAANERIIGDENNSYNDDGDNNDNLEDDEENEEEEEEEEEEEDDEEDYDDEHSTSNLSPIVQVKYNCEYDYDNRKFRLSEGETLFLINKSNEDWWLCLRLAEKLTFFVPASYVKEVAVVPPSSARRLQPPPRPPPPPPPAPSQRASTSSSRQQTPSVIIESPKPQVKKRQHLINNTNTNNDNTNNNNNNSRSRANMDSVYENLAESGSGRPTPSAAAEDYGGLNPDAIISDLDDRLNREEESFVALNKTANIASSTSSGVCVGGPANAGDMLLERRPNLLFPNNTNTVSDLMTLNASLTATSSSSSSSTSGTQSHQQPHMQVVMASAASIEPDYEDEENDEDDSSHIYQNFPFVERKKLPPTTTPTSTTSTFTSEQQRKSAPARIVNAQLSISKEAAVDEKEDEPTTTTNKSDEDDEEEDEDEDEEEEEDDEEEDEDEEKENDAQYLNSKSADDNKPTIYVPKGWKVELTKYKRKCFVNELNGDKWYLNYDQNGNHYFYNANNESVWHLPNVYSQENDDDKSANNTASSSNPNNSNFFKNLIDQELPTFKNLYSRLSTSSKRGNNQTTTVSSDQATTTTKSSLFPARSDLNSTLAATATAASNSYLAADTNSTGISSSSSSGKQTTPSSSNSASRLIAPSTVPLTTVSYSNKPPSDLNFTFKCILLAKGGKKCRKKTSDSYKVSLVSTKILFVKDSKTPKLEFFVDFKGGKCFKVEPLATNANNSTLTGHKKSSSISNNDVLGSKIANSSANKEREKALKEKEKERAEILDLVGSNKSALVVETLTGYRILMISENDQVVNDWVYAINSIITQIQSEFSPIYEGPELLHSTQLHEFELNSRPKCSHLPQPPLTPSSDSNTNKKQHKNKECVFGSNLINLCKKEKRNVPSFVDEIIASIESKGLDADGLYRISGNLSEVQKVRYQVDHGKYNFKDFDIHVLCGALKTFFRELEDSLIPFAFHQHFINSTTIQDRSKRFQYVQELLKKLPLAHRETLRNLLRHLLKVIDLSAHNRMNLQNIALVFGPNIMRGNPLNEASTGFNPHIMTQNSIVEYLLAHFKDLYSFQPNSIFTEYSEFM